MHYNIQQEQRVWERVGGVQPREDSVEGSLNAESVLNKASRELEQAALYQYLACRVPGACGRILGEIGQEKLCHARELRSIYFVLTGRKACPPKAQEPCVTCISETLRRLYRQELADAEENRAIAQRGTEFSCTFEKMAQDNLCNAEKLLRIIGCVL